MLPQGTESMPNAPVTAPPPESLRDELSTLVGNEVSRLRSRPLGSSFEESPYRGRGRQRAINRESHHAPGVVIDSKLEPSAEWPDLGQGEGKPGRPSSACRL